MYLIPEDMAPVAFLLTPIGESSGAKPMADESLSARLGKLTEQVVERATKGLAQGQGPSHIQATAASSAPSFFLIFPIVIMYIKHATEPWAVLKCAPQW